MKILYVTVSLPFGHGEAFTLAEIGTLLAQGHDVRIVPVNPAGGVVRHTSAADLLPLTVRTPVVTARILWAALQGLFRTPRTALHLIRVLIGSRTTGIALKNLCVYPKGAWIARLAAEWQADHIHASWASVPATVAMIASELSGTPFSFTAHRWDITENNLLDAKTARAVFVRFIAQHGLSTAQALGVPGLDEKGVVIHVGVKVPLATTTSATTRTEAVLLCPAFLNPNKGHTYLFQALRMLIDRGNRCRLILAGDGVSASVLKNEVGRLGLEDAVEFRGNVAHDDLLRMYAHQEIDIVVLSSRIEGIPVALMEAMAHAIPVVATSVGGVPELLSGGGGLMVAPGDVVALAEALERLLRCPADAQAIGAVGRHTIMAEFNADGVSRRLEQLLLGHVEAGVASGLIAGAA